MVKSQPKGKNDKKPRHREPHLIQKLTQNYSEPKEEDGPIECKYGLYCAHLRVNGSCHFPHKRNHYLFLNLFPPQNAIDDRGDEEEQKLTKKEKKQKKIIQKTISQNIDIEALEKRQIESKKKIQLQKQQQFYSKMDEKEKKLSQLNNSSSAQDYFARLNQIKVSFSAFEFRKRSLIQIKKKNDKLYADIIDKQYRIANRLIKQALKNKKQTLLEIYLDINHNTIPSIRQYFEDYFDQDKGIPQEEVQDIENERLFLKKILTSLFFREPSDYQYQYFLIKAKSTLSQIKSNIEIFNLMVPFLHSQTSPFNKYLLLDCSLNLSLTALSQFLSNDYATTFHIKSKPYPQYPFGQLQSNTKSFTHWASKLASKYKQTKESNIILILSDITHILPQQNTQQFEQQKLKQRRSALNAFLTIFQPVIYFLTDNISNQMVNTLSSLMDLPYRPCKYENKVQQIEQK